MIESVSVTVSETAKAVSQVSTATVQPKVEQFAIDRFDGLQANDVSNNINSTRLQITHTEPDALQKVFSAFSEMDAGYQRLANSMDNRTTFRSYLSDRGIAATGELENIQAGGRHVSNSQDVNAGSGVLSVEGIVDGMKNDMERQVAYMGASSDFAHERSQWTHMVEMWASKMKIMTAAVKQVNTGLKTLFQAQ